MLKSIIPYKSPHGINDSWIIWKYWEVDQDGDNELDWDEFLGLMGETAENIEEEDIIEVFNEVEYHTKLSLAI